NLGVRTVGRNGLPDVDIAIGKLKRRRHDADDRNRRISKMQGLAQNPGIGAEMLSPYAIADQSSTRPAVSFLLGGKIASQGGRDAEHLKKAGCDEGLFQFFGKRAGGLRLVVGVITGDRLEG